MASLLLVAVCMKIEVFPDAYLAYLSNRMAIIFAWVASRRLPNLPGLVFYFIFVCMLDLDFGSDYSIGNNEIYYKF